MRSANINMNRIRIKYNRKMYTKFMIKLQVISHQLDISLGQKWPISYITSREEVLCLMLAVEMAETCP